MTGIDLQPDDRRFSLIRVEGSDREAFLQGQLTQDIRAARAGEALLAGWASPKGRLITLFWVATTPEAVLLVCPTALATSVAQRLRLFVLRADVRISLVDAGVEPTVSSSNVSSTLDLTYCFNDDLITIANQLNFEFKRAGGTGGPASADWRLAAIRLGIPTVWGETREAFVPQMLNLDLLNGISFTKGCYVGQEIVARTQNLGRIKRRMYRFSAAADVAVPPPGTGIYAEGRTVGEVVDAVATAAGIELLAVCRIESLHERLSLDEHGAAVIRQQSLPYAIPETI